MRKALSIVLLLILVLASLGPAHAASKKIRKIHGLNLSPYLDKQDPNTGVIILKNQIEDLVKRFAPYAEWLKSFSSTHGLENIGPIAHQYKRKAAVGAWLSRDMQSNDKEMEGLIRVCRAGGADLAVIGSETLFRNDLTPEQLIGYIDRFKSELPGFPVTTADIAGELMDHPEVMDNCDLVMANIYPFWEGVHIDRAVAALHCHYLDLKDMARGKPVVIGETGWPSAGDTIGDAVPNSANASFYFKNVVSWAEAEKVKVFYFEAFDEQWKIAYEGEQGGHWGVWKVALKMKKGMQKVFDGERVPNNWNCGAEPAVVFTYVPPMGSNDDLKGVTHNISPRDYAIAVYIKVFGGWWTKPTFANPVTVIKSDGTFVCDITTGGSDTKASEIIAFAIPNDYPPPTASNLSRLPQELYDKSIAYASVTR